jgi:hypothetical protein
MARFLVLLIICVLAIWHVLLVSLSIRRGLDDVQMHESGHLLAVLLEWNIPFLLPADPIRCSYDGRWISE